MHSDICGYVPVSTTEDRYFITFLDDATHMVWCFPLPDRNGTRLAGLFSDWMEKAQRQAGRQLKVLRTDGAGELVSGLSYTLRTQGITQEEPGSQEAPGAGSGAQNEPSGLGPPIQG